MPFQHESRPTKNVNKTNPAYNRYGKYNVKLIFYVQFCYRSFVRFNNFQVSVLRCYQ